MNVNDSEYIYWGHDDHNELEPFVELLSTSDPEAYSSDPSRDDDDDSEFGP